MIILETADGLQYLERSGRWDDAMFVERLILAHTYTATEYLKAESDPKSRRRRYEFQGIYKKLHYDLPVKVFTEVL